MEFERARTQEQKNVRVMEIVEAAIKQYNTTPYEHITLASISKDLSFSRVNLYKYFKTKEEIFLKIIELDIYRLSDKLRLIFTGQPSKNLQAFADKWAAALHSQGRLIELISRLFADIEKNTAVDKLAAFKTAYYELNEDILDIVKEQFPSLSKSQIGSFIFSQYAFMAGLYPMCRESESQKNAVEMAGHKYVPRDFVKELSSFVVTYIRGLEK
ncbi:MAG: TetR/AcrR family transcriptional regulator [Clostridia bacterium]|nr:TetR/AcrR family transcriptional regulator [Clostridia bacterium]